MVLSTGCFPFLCDARNGCGPFVVQDSTAFLPYPGGMSEGWRMESCILFGDVLAVRPQAGLHQRGQQTSTSPSPRSLCQSGRQFAKHHAARISCEFWDYPATIGPWPVDGRDRKRCVSLSVVMVTLSVELRFPLCPLPRIAWSVECCKAIEHGAVSST